MWPGRVGGLMQASGVFLRSFAMHPIVLSRRGPSLPSYALTSFAGSRSLRWLDCE